jgi:hypothetical protein
VLESLDRGAVARDAGHKGEVAAFWLCSPPCTARPLGREMGAFWCVRQPDQARNRSARLPVQDERNATAGDRHFRSSVRIQQRSSATAALTLRTSSSSPAAPVDDSSIRDRAAVSPAVARLLSGVEQPRRFCPQRPPHAARRASAHDRFRPRPAGRPTTAMATTHSSRRRAPRRLLFGGHAPRRCNRVLHRGHPRTEAFSAGGCLLWGRRWWLICESHRA